MIVYVSIGNSDNHLEQVEWARFCRQLEHLLDDNMCRVFGVWFSLSNSAYQNMCMAGEVEDVDMADLRRNLGLLAADFNQESIAMVVVRETEFVRPPLASNT